MSSSGQVRTTVSVGGQTEVDRALGEIRRSFEQMRGKTDAVAASMDKLQRASGGIDVVTRHAREAARAMGILAETGGRATSRLVDDAGQATRAYARWQAGVERLHRANEAAGRRSAFQDSIREMTGRDLPAAEGRVQSFSDRVRGLGGQLGTFGSGVAAGFGAVALAAGGAIVIVRELTQAVGWATRAFVDLGQRGGEVSDVANAFERIASPSLIENLSAASAGLMTNVQLMTGAIQALRTGLATESDLVRWTSGVTEAAQAMGRNVPDAFRAVITAISGGGLETLGQLGVNMMEIRDRLRQVGETMESERGRILALNMAVEQLTANAGASSGETTNLNNAWAAIGVTLTNWVDEMARAVSESQPLIRFFVSFRDALEGSLPPGREVADLIVEIASSGILAANGLTRALIPLVTVVGRFLEFGFRLQSMANPVEWITGYSASMATAIDASIEGLNQLGSALDATQGSFDELEAAMRAGRSSLDDLSGPLSRARGDTDSLRSSVERLSNAGIEFSRTSGPLASDAIADIGRSARTAARNVDSLRASIGAARLERAEELGLPLPGLRRETPERVAEDPRIAEARERVKADAEERAAAAARGRRGGGGGRGRGDDEVRALNERVMEVKRIFAEQMREQERVDQAAEQAAMQAREAMRAWWAEEDQRAIDEIDRVRELHDAKMEAIHAEMEAAAAASASERAKTMELLNQTGQIAGQIQGVFGQIDATIGAAMDNALARSISQAEAMGASAEEISAMATANEQKKARAKGVFLIAYSTVMALVETAEAISSFAHADIGAGTEHLLSAATFTAAAVMAGIQLGGGGAGAAPAPKSTFTRQQPTIEPDERDRGGVTIIHQYSLGRTEAGLGRELERAQWERRRQGAPSPDPHTMEYDA